MLPVARGLILLFLIQVAKGVAFLLLRVNVIALLLEFLFEIGANKIIIYSN